MKKSVQFAGILAAALTITSVACLSANAETRHQDESWRQSSRNSDRDFLTGYVERIDYRRGVVMLRTRDNRRAVAVEMAGRSRNGNRGLDLGDLRRGDRVTFIGDWDRGGVFTAWRIDDIDARNGRNRGRW